MKFCSCFRTRLHLASDGHDCSYWIWQFFLALTVALLVPAIGAATSITQIASGQAIPNGIVVSGNTLYFASSNGGAPTINSVGTNGGSVSTLYSGLVSPNSLAVVGTALFWIDANSGPVTDTQILTAPAGGGGPITAIYTGVDVGQPIVDGSGIATDGTQLFTADEVQGRVDSLAFNGTGLTQLGPNRYGGFFDTEHQNSIATANGLVYVLDSGKPGVDNPQLVTIPAGGGASFQSLLTGAPLVLPTSITIGGGQMFIGDGDTIWTMPVGGGPLTVFFSGGPLVDIGNSALFYDNGTVFVGDRGASAIFRIDAVPEPSTFSFLALGLLGLGVGSTRIFAIKKAVGASAKRI